MQRHHWLLVCVLAAWLWCCCDAQSLSLVKLTDEQSVCNDGSPGAFYWRAGNQSVGQGRRRYIVHLQGGYWCWDEASCLQRQQTQPYLTSSSSYSAASPPGLATAGLFDTDRARNPAWADASVAYVMYCSSDAFAGDGQTTFGSDSVWQFRGRNILRSVITVLIKQPQFGGLSLSDELLLSGCSAGGQGVVNTADFVRRTLVDLLGQLPAKYRAMADAGWMQSPSPLQPSIQPIINEFVAAAPMWGGGPNENCALANPGIGLPLCYLTQFAWPHMDTPLLVQSSQYDAFQVPYNVGAGPPYDNRTMAYVQGTLRPAFAYSMREVRPPSGIFSPACYYHCISEDSNFYTMLVPDQHGVPVSFNTTLAAWFAAPEQLYVDSKQFQIQADCQAFNCGINCPPA